MATLGRRYFGFVTGGSLDAATCADLLAVGWDQDVFNPVLSPAAAVVEEAAGAWLKDLLGIPGAVSVGFVTGEQAANTVGLAAARPSTPNHDRVPAGRQREHRCVRRPRHRCELAHRHEAWVHLDGAFGL